MTEVKIAKIYKIVGNDGNQEICYYGSTTNTLAQRFSQHKYDYKRYKKGKFSYVTSFQIFQNFIDEDIQIILVDTFVYKNKKHMHNIEAEYIKNNECINKYIPNRTTIQWQIDNREKYLAQMKQWKNTKHICLCGCNYIRGSRAKHLRTAKHRKLLFEKIGEFVQKYKNILNV